MPAGWCCGRHVIFYCLGFWTHLWRYMRPSNCGGMFRLEILGLSLPNVIHVVTVHVRSRGRAPSPVLDMPLLSLVTSCRNVPWCEGVWHWLDAKCPVLRLLNSQAWNGIGLVKDCSVTVGIHLLLTRVIRLQHNWGKLGCVIVRPVHRACLENQADRSSIYRVIMPPFHRGRIMLLHGRCVFYYYYFFNIYCPFHPFPQ